MKNGFEKAAAFGLYEGEPHFQPVAQGHHPACLTAGVMNLVQMSRSLSDFLSSPGICGNTSQVKALVEPEYPFPLEKSPRPHGRKCLY
jgi:hypothetical protein